MKVENAIWKEATYKPPCQKGLPESESVKALKERRNLRLRLVWVRRYGNEYYRRRKE